MLARESGPMAILHRFRKLIGVEHDGTDEAQGKNWFADGILCVWCNSIWFSFVLAIVLGGTPLDIVIKTLAFSAGAIGIEKLYG